ncbi:hypothetical protein [Rickettsiales endosymbiont of Peranema trichophorum]|uniref:hypothetical protein n=1 Tax=Rickettsiales endosymbiont of Peranema trichophorum TaxID=2486577 RepID=UPI001A925BD1|nr:hypothetical protein [Rickettsiales endosymbiont of Peranema trichophorum]
MESWCNETVLDFFQTGIEEEVRVKFKELEEYRPEECGYFLKEIWYYIYIYHI